LVEYFDAPDINIDYVLEEINREIKKYGCYLNVSKIVKEIDVNNLENNLQDYLKAVSKVDKIYEEL
jgi:hypothetical protein